MPTIRLMAGGRQGYVQLHRIPVSGDLILLPKDVNDDTMYRVTEVMHYTELSSHKPIQVPDVWAVPNDPGPKARKPRDNRTPRKAKTT